MIKKTAIKDFENIRRTGIIAISLGKGDFLKWVQLVEEGDEISLTTHLGQAIRFKEKDARSMGRTAAGVRAIRLKNSDEVSSMDVIPKARIKDSKSKFLVVMAHGFGKQTPISQYKVQKRGGSGIKTAKVTAKTGPVIAARLVDEEEELLALSAKGQIIRTKLASVRVASRATSGVRIMRLGEGDKVAGIVIL